MVFAIFINIGYSFEYIVEITIWDDECDNATLNYGLILKQEKSKKYYW